MAPAKRERPVFSPPRPKKTTTNTSTSKSAIAKGKAPKANASTSNSKSQGVTKRPKTKATEPDTRRRSRLVSPTPSASDSLGNDSDGDESMNVGEDDESNLSTRNAEDSPEPDYILAEVTHENDSSKEPPIPLGLIHRILHSQFAEPESTKISTDAREIVGKYVEVFVREAIMRCAYEKNKGADREGTGGEKQPVGGGWLDLEDLEKVAVQLCLDF